jgi:hypothetical protein
MWAPDSAHIQVSDLQALLPEQPRNKTIFDLKIVRLIRIWTADLQDPKLACYQPGQADYLPFKDICFPINIHVMEDNKSHWQP